MARPVLAQRLTVKPDYFQFYARRSDADWASDRVPSAGYEAHIWSDGGFVYIGTARKYGPTPVAVEVWDEAPPPATAPTWQHVGEVSLGPGRDFEVLDWDDNAPRPVKVGRGPQTLRVHWAGLVPGRFEGLDEDGNSDEHLLMQLWPAPVAPARVLRWWTHWKLPAPSDRSPDGRRQNEGLEAVIERLPSLERLLESVPHPPIRMPGGGDTSSVVGVLFDPAERTWWADGYDVRRTLREITREEAQALIAAAQARKA